MLINNLFIENPIDFEKRCKTRIITGILLAILGAAGVILFLMADRIPVLYLEPGQSDFVPGFYMGTGCGLIGAGLITAIKNFMYLKNPELKNKQSIYENDERNRMIGLRCWAYTGYATMILLYLGILVSGFISMTVLKTLLVVLAVFAVLLMIFRTILQKAM